MKAYLLKRPMLVVLVFLASQLLVGVLVGLAAVPAIGTDYALPTWALALTSILSGLLMVALCVRPLRVIRFRDAFRSAHLPARTIILGMCGGIAALMGTSFLSEQMQFTDLMAEQLAALAHSSLGWLAACLVGPVVEELVFREGIQGHMQRQGASPAWAVLVSCVLFSLIHANPAQCLVALPMGVVLSVLYLRTNNVLLCGALHIFNNTAAMLQYAISAPQPEDTPLTDMVGGTTGAYVATAVWAVVAYVLLKWFLEGKGEKSPQ